MRNIFALILFALFSSVSGSVYYLSPQGDDLKGNGSKNYPWFTLEKGWKAASAGDTIYLRGGTYAFITTQDLTGKNGLPGKLIKIWAYPGEKPIITKGSVFDMQYQSNLIFIESNYLHFKGLEISYFTQKPGIRANSALFGITSNSIFENLNYHHNGLGMVIRGKSTNNLILNCDFHNNYDPYDTSPYCHADGLNIAWIPEGSVNTVKDCRFYRNADDGIDLWNNEGVVKIEGCWAWQNGYREDGYTTGGDGAGFKLGQTETINYSVYKRILINNISVSNRNFGISQNAATCKMFICNNILYDNKQKGIYFSASWGDAQHMIRNNIAYKNLTDAAIGIKLPIVDHNSWQTGFTVTNQDFKSVDPTQLARPRKSNGTLPDIDFMHLATGSKLIDAGIDIGLPYLGKAPDLGAFESATTSPVVVNQKPTVSISSPLKSASFTSPATITVTAAASDPDGTITKVEFFQGSVKIGEKTTTPYSITWKEVPDGTYSLTAAATDNANSKTVSAAVSITVIKPVAVENKPPIVSISSPAKGASYTSPATITVTAAASDPDGTITKVEFFQGSVKIGEKTTTPFSITWKDVPEGTYSLTAAATDNKNSKTVSAAVTVTVVKPVAAENKLPTVSISSPAKGASFTSPATITINATASDSDGTIAKVEFFQGSVKIGEKTTSPFSITWKDVPEGTYSLTAAATDNKNSKTVSAAVSITVVKPAPPENKLPTVSITSPAKGASFTSPATITINATASDPDGTIAKVEFFQGSVKIGEKTTSPYSITWTEVPDGSYSLTAAATDNKSSKTVSAAVSITVVKPATPINATPSVSISSPTKGSSFTAPATVTIDVNASDPDGSITKVELFNGTVKLFEKTAAPYSFTLKDLPVGSYDLKAVATDNMKAIATSSYHTLTVTPILEARDYFNLYPNPNDGRFSIEFTSLLDADIFTITVVDLIGKTVYREELSKDESTRQFDLSHLNSGIYILMIAANQIVLTQKFIKR